MSVTENDANSGDYPFARLQISDLLVLTLTVAFGMAWVGALGSGGPPADAAAHWSVRLGAAAWDACSGGLIGLEMFGVAVIIRELFRGRPLQSLAPGHWWFLATAPQFALGSVQFLIALWGMGQNYDLVRWRVVEGGIIAASHFAIAIAWLWTAIKLKTRPWRVIFSLRAGEQLVWALFRFSRAARTAGYSVPNIHAMHFFGVMGTLFICILVLLPIALFSDRSRGIKRDWLHNLGAALIVAESLNFFFGFGRLFWMWWAAIWLQIAGLFP